jgi:RNA polymerase sigma-70 factor (ECF subfamily)
MRVDTGHTERSAEDALPEWTRRLAAGEEEAWHWFHERYYLPLLRYAAHCGGDPSAASEIVQQSYLRIARHVKPFAGEDAFWGWLCCVVRCVAVDHARHITRRAALLEKLAHWRAAQSATDAAWPPSANDAAALAEEALAKLSDADAALLRRKYCDGCSVEELAASHGTTPKAIEHRIARLRERLREIILRLR